MKRLLGLFVSMVLAVCLITGFSGCGKDKTPEEDKTVTEENDKQNDKENEGGIAIEDMMLPDVALVRKNGKLSIGITEHSPFHYIDTDGNMVGVDTDLAMLFSIAGLEVDYSFVYMYPEEIETALYEGTIDCYWSGVLDTEYSDLHVSRSVPYMKNGQVVVVPKEKVNEYKSIEDMKDLTFSVCKDSYAEEALKQLGYKYITSDFEYEALFAISAGTADAVVVSGLSVDTMVGEDKDYDYLACTDIVLDMGNYVVLFRENSDLAVGFEMYFNENRSDFLDRAIYYNISTDMIPEI